MRFLFRNGLERFANDGKNYSLTARRTRRRTFALKSLKWNLSQDFRHCLTKPTQYFFYTFRMLLLPLRMGRRKETTLIFLWTIWSTKRAFRQNSEKARLARRKKSLRRLFRSAKEKLLFWFFSCFFGSFLVQTHKKKRWMRGASVYSMFLISRWSTFQQKIFWWWKGA